MTSRNAKPLFVAADLEWCPRPAMHALLCAALCCLPALFLIPVRWLDREPDNVITHAQEGEPGRDPDAGLAIAA